MPIYPLHMIVTYNLHMIVTASKLFSKVNILKHRVFWMLIWGSRNRNLRNTALHLPNQVSWVTNVITFNVNIAN